MEDTGATIPEYQPLALVLRLRTRNHPFGSNSPPYLSIIIFVMCRIVDPKFVEIHRSFLLLQHYKVFFTTKKFLTSRRFFSLFLSFLSHTFCGLAGVWGRVCGRIRESWKSFQTLFLCIHLFVQ